MTEKSKPQRQREHEAMLEEALSRPGVYDVMRVYQNWQQRDRGLDAYRSAIKARGIGITTDHANAPKPD